jgi:RNA polymerase sigma-70 factor (ECF subfamily)
MAVFSLNLNGDSMGTLELSAHEDTLSAEELVADLFLEMRTPVLRHLLWLHLSPDQAEDVVQETFLRLYQQMHRKEFSRHNLRGWVWRVAHNLGVNLRQALNRKERGMEIGLESVSDWLADTRPDPEQKLEQKQRERRVAAGMKQLNERDLQCLHLRTQGLGYRQISSILGIGRSTVADTLNRATAFLRSYHHS